MKYKRVLVVRGANDDDDDVDVDVDNNDDDRPTVVNASTKEVNANATDNTPTMIEIDCFILLISLIDFLYSNDDMVIRYMNEQDIL